MSFWRVYQACVFHPADPHSAEKMRFKIYYSAGESGDALSHAADWKNLPENLYFHLGFSFLAAVSRSYPNFSTSERLHSPSQAFERL